MDSLSAAFVIRQTRATLRQSRKSKNAGYDGIEFGFDEPVRIDEPGYLNARVHRPYLLDDLAVTLAMACQSSIRVSKNRVRITSSRLAPSSFSAARDFGAASRLRGGIAASDRIAVWTEGAVLPIAITLPMRTAREKLTMRSKGLPEETRSRGLSSWSLPIVVLS